MLRYATPVLLAALLLAGAAAATIDLCPSPMTPPDAQDVGPTWKRFAIGELLARREKSERRYLEFLRVPTMNMGVYVLPAGSVDRQSPHGLDEVYFVLDGKARFTAGSEETTAEKGDVLFVAAGVAHRFHDIEDDLELLVFFSAAKPKPKKAEAEGKERDK